MDSDIDRNGLSSVVLINNTTQHNFSIIAVLLQLFLWLGINAFEHIFAYKVNCTARLFLWDELLLLCTMSAYVTLLTIFVLLLTFLILFLTHSCEVKDVSVGFKSYIMWVNPSSMLKIQFLNGLNNFPCKGFVQ